MHLRVDNDLTPWFDVEACVKQGCSLSPTRFPVCINDLAECTNSLTCGINIDDIRLGILQYTDDIALIAPDEDSLQCMVDIVSDWSVTWKLSINSSKTNVVHFRPKSCTDYVIDYCDSNKYLGVWKDENLTFNKNAKELEKSASSVTRIVYF
jgi:hypothetical protein